MYALPATKRLDGGLEVIAENIFGEDFSKVRIRPQQVVSGELAEKLGAFKIPLYDANTNTVNLPVNLPDEGIVKCLIDAHAEYQQQRKPKHQSKSKFYYKEIPAAEVPAKVRAAIELTARKVKQDLGLFSLPTIRYLVTSDSITNIHSDEGIGGYYHRPTRVVYIRTDLSTIPDVRETTAHEIKHYDQHRRGEAIDEKVADGFGKKYRGSELSESDIIRLIGEPAFLQRPPCDHEVDLTRRAPICDNCIESQRIKEGNEYTRQQMRALEASGYRGGSYQVRDSYSEMHRERRLKNLRGDEIKKW